MGYTTPNVAVMAAVETVNPKMQETVDAFRLKQMNEDGKIVHCIVEGPISYDLAMDKESAAIKGYQSPIVGETDIMIMPNIAAGNLMAKSLVYSGGAAHGKPYIHLGPVALDAVGNHYEECKADFEIFGRRFAEKARELFPNK